MISNLRRIMTKKGELMAFVTLEDVQGSIEITVFPRVFQQTEALWEIDRIVIVHGKVDVRDDKVSIICDAVQPYSEEMTEEMPAEGNTDSVWLEPPSEVNNENGGNSAPIDNGHKERSARSRAGNGTRKGTLAPLPRRHLRIVVPYEDEESGVKRLHALHDVLARYPGDDRISLWLQSALTRVKLSTTMTTHYCDALATDLDAILGPGNVEVEEI